MTTKSKYKYLGGFGIILGLNIYSTTWPRKIFPNVNLDFYRLENWQNEYLRKAMLFFLGIQGIFLLLLMTQCKFIIASIEGITFVNPLLPFIRKKRNWSDYDYFQTVQEKSTWTTHESIWFIKDNKLKDRISSYYYSNYYEIKAEVKAEDRGLLQISQYRQLLCWFGARIDG